MPTRAKAQPWELSDELWTQVAPLLPKVVPKTRGRGRARRKVGCATVLIYLTLVRGSATGKTLAQAASPGGRGALVRQMPTRAPTTAASGPRTKAPVMAASTDRSCVFEDSTDTRKPPPNAPSAYPSTPPRIPIAMRLLTPCPDSYCAGSALVFAWSSSARI